MRRTRLRDQKTAPPNEQEFKGASARPSFFKVSAERRNEQREQLVELANSSSEELGTRVREKFNELGKSHGWEETYNYLQIALMLGQVNTRLRDKAVENASEFLSSNVFKLPGFEKKFHEAANALNYAMGQCSEPIFLALYTDMMQPETLGINRWQLWKLSNYEEKCDGNSIVFYCLYEALKKYGDKPVDYSGLVELMARTPTAAISIANGETPEAQEWLRDASKKHEMSLVTAEELRTFLHVVANAVANRPVQIIPGGDHFSTDGEVEHVPSVFGRFPTKEENKLAYRNGVYHESYHIFMKSFEVDALDVNLKKIGYRVKPGRHEEDEPLIIEEVGGKNSFEAYTTMDLLRCFSNPVLAKELLNIIEDRRIDAGVVRDNPGMAAQYGEENRKILQFRPVAKEAGKATHVLEAFTQLVLSGETREPMPKELEEKVMPLVEIALGVSVNEENATKSLNAVIEIYEKLVEDHPELENPAIRIPMPGNWRPWEDHESSSDPDLGEIEVTMHIQGDGDGEGEPCSLGESSGSESGSEGDGKRKNKEGEGKEDSEKKEGEKKKKGEGGEEDKGKKNDDENKGKHGGKNRQRGKRNKKKPSQERGKNGGKAIENQTKELRIDWDTETDGPGTVLGEYEHDEWNYKKNCYIRGYTKVTEIRPELGSPVNVDPMLANAVRTAFMKLKPAYKEVVRGQYDGDDIDIDRLLEYSIDCDFGEEAEENYYTRTVRRKRSVATAILCDCSGSTSFGIRGAWSSSRRGRVIDIEREALEVFAGGLKEIGDPFAIYGYDSHGRENNNFYVAKEFNEPYRTPGFAPRNANRDGAHIRHATKKLLERPEKTRVLIIISDGKPNDDGSHYEGRYALEDTRKAVEDAATAGVAVFCISIRPDGDNSELIDMYGPGRSFALSDISKLPIALPLLYRIITRI